MGCVWSALIGLKQSTHFSAIYLLLVMAMSMMSLLGTVAVLALHHHNPADPIPPWLAKLLRLYPKKIQSSTTALQQNNRALTQVVPFSLPMDNTKEKVDIASVPTSLWEQMLEEMKKMNSSGKTENVHHNMWQKAASKLDRYMLYIFGAILVLTNGIFFLLLNV